MSRIARWPSVLAGVFILISFQRAIGAEEMVPVPKSRLRELERKEAELEKLKRQLHDVKDEGVRLKPSVTVAGSETSTPSLDQIPHVSPPLDSLAPLQPGDIVDALDLFNHYRVDQAAAARRYGKRTLLVHGTILGFDKPMFARPYHILLRTADRSGCVVCKFELPEKFNAAFTVKNGTELVGESGQRARVTIGKIGDEIKVQGTCKGLSDGNVILTDCETK